ncbi:hypothetical protein I6H52_09150 [Corynebacterium urealyticum]|uniref:hypothetical protein n=1 Tax=Corynebacterium urealyticum TaxID=43771 RepID=UPI0019106BA2|nr:hypothetical protein [Corynebacterium urealyticum]QQE50646.1 hypothetical protein I6H52_09150 [Corynebacterium urealyticum]
MGAKTILGGLLAGAVGIPALTVLTSFIINDPNAAWSVVDGLIIAVGASLTTVWVAVLGGYLFLRSRTEPARGTVLTWAGVGCAMLLLGFGSTALYAWEEVAAGQVLPVINLFILLIPLGIISVAVAFSRS